MENVFRLLKRYGHSHKMPLTLKTDIVKWNSPFKIAPFCLGNFGYCLIMSEWVIFPPAPVTVKI